MSARQRYLRGLQGGVVGRLRRYWRATFETARPWERSLAWGGATVLVVVGVALGTILVAGEFAHGTVSAVVLASAYTFGILAVLVGAHDLLHASTVSVRRSAASATSLSAAGACELFALAAVSSC